MNFKKRLFVIDNMSNSNISAYFEKFNYNIECCSRLPCLNELKSADALLIHDALLMPQPLATIHQLYQNKPVPIIISSDKKNDVLCSEMLEAGADDVVIKPIHPHELHARINAIYRRIYVTNKDDALEKEVFRFSHFRLDPASRQLLDETNQARQLSVSEYDLLLVFLRHPQRILTREFLNHASQGGDYHPLDRRIDIRVSRLRQKIEQNVKFPELIKTIRNSGYLFTSPVSSCLHLK